MHVFNHPTDVCVAPLVGEVLCFHWLVDMLFHTHSQKTTKLAKDVYTWLISVDKAEA